MIFRIFHFFDLALTLTVALIFPCYFHMIWPFHPLNNDSFGNWYDDRSFGFTSWCLSIDWHVDETSSRDMPLAFQWGFPHSYGKIYYCYDDFSLWWRLNGYIRDCYLAMLISRCWEEAFTCFLIGSFFLMCVIGCLCEGS